MNCPLCLDPVLEERFSTGIEVDVCPNCKGIWLDRGELERLMTNAAYAPVPWSGDEPDDTQPAMAASDNRPGEHNRDRKRDDDRKRDRDKDRDRDRDRNDDRDDDRDQDDDDRDRRKSKSKSKKKKKSKKKRWGEMLEDVLDDVLDL